MIIQKNAKTSPVTSSFTSKEPVYYISKKQLFHSNKWRKKANPVYLKACEFFGATLIDRTGVLDTGINFKVLDSLEGLTQNSLSFSEVCAQRASDIVDRATDKVMSVLWSGGIDSTVALIALTQELKRRDELYRLKVLLSKESIAEFPSFFEEKIRRKLGFQVMDKTIYDHIDHKEVSITGEHGDQIFGSDKLKYAVMSGEAHRPHSEILEYVISRKLGTEKFTRDIIDFIAPQLAKSPVKINTLYDYLWWLNFSLKWQNVSLRIIHGLDQPYAILNHSLFHFFQSHAFQSWSICNHDKKIRDEWKTYKYVAKDYIHNFHKDSDYLDNKEKEPSLKQVIMRDQGRSVLRFPIRVVKKLKYAFDNHA